MGRRPTPTVLKLIRGDLHTARHKDDKPKIPGLPLLPPGMTLTPPEREIWDYLMQHVVTPGVHGTGDGLAFLKIVRLVARADEADRKCAEKGTVMKNPESGKPELSPHARHSRDLWQQIGLALRDVGATPAGRVPLAGPRAGRTPGDATSWDEID